MDFLTENPVMRMPGPQFLGFYAVCAAVALVGFNAWLAFDEPARAPPPPLPSAPDPYEIAYLRGGPSAVIGVAIYALKRAGVIVATDDGALAQTAGAAEPSDPIQARVWQSIGAGAAGSAVLSAPSLRHAVESLCRGQKGRLENFGLLVTSRRQRRILGLALIVGLFLVGLAGLKIRAAIAHGRHNYGFLPFEAWFALLALFINALALGSSWANGRGKAYLRRLKLAFQDVAPRVAGMTRGPGAVGETTALVIVGAFGLEILRGGPDSALAQLRGRDGGSGGGSCSSGGSGDGGGCGSGCGGCGGGD